MRKLELLILTAVGSLFGTHAQNTAMDMTRNMTAPNMNIQNLSYTGAPLITGNTCNYMWHEEFNTLLVTCHNSEMMLVGEQVRVLQNPIKQCYTGNDVYMPAF